MLDELLTKEESKTLEFKENAQSIQKIIQTIVAFANTAGGILVIGVRDKTKEVVGITNILEAEARIANAIADSVEPLLIPSLQLHTWRGRDLLLVSVSHNFGPYYLKSKGVNEGTYIRFGSTNRLADSATILEIQRWKAHKYFDEQPNFDCNVDQINFDLATNLFDNISKKFTHNTAKSLTLRLKYQEREVPSNGAVLLFADHPGEFFPDAMIRLGRFLGRDKTQILDQQILDLSISIALESIITFIRRHTSTAAEIGATRRKDIPQYPPAVVREAVVNALLHTDYSIKGASIQIAIFDDRIEITNPGSLPYGLDLETALSGVSQLRNRVIGRVFRELNLIEQWGSGLGRMMKICQQQGISVPKFEELGNFFRTTLYHDMHEPQPMEEWQQPIITYLKKHKEILPKEAQAIWKVTSRTASSRLKKMREQGVIVEISTSRFDPQKRFILRSS